MSEHNLSQLSIDEIERVSGIFNHVFAEVLQHHIILLNERPDDQAQFRNDVMHLILNYNPMNAMRVSDISNIFSLYNERMELRNFFNRLYYRFMTRVDDVTFHGIAVRLSRGLTMKLLEKQSGLTRFTRGSKPIGIHQDLMNEMLDTQDIQTVLLANPFLVVVFMALTYLDMETYLTALNSNRIRNKGG